MFKKLTSTNACKLSHHACIQNLTTTHMHSKLHSPLCMQALSPRMHSKPHYHTHVFKTSLTVMHASSLTMHAFKTSLPHTCIQNFTLHANFTVKNRCPWLVAQLGYELNSTSHSNLTLHAHARVGCGESWRSPHLTLYLAAGCSHLTLYLTARCSHFSNTPGAGMWSMFAPKWTSACELLWFRGSAKGRVI